MPSRIPTLTAAAGRPRSARAAGPGSASATITPSRRRCRRSRRGCPASTCTWAAAPIRRLPPLRPLPGIDRAGHDDLDHATIHARRPLAALDQRRRGLGRDAAGARHLRGVTRHDRARRPAELGGLRARLPRPPRDAGPDVRLPRGAPDRRAEHRRRARMGQPVRVLLLPDLERPQSGRQRLRDLLRAVATTWARHDNAYATAQGWAATRTPGVTPDGADHNGGAPSATGFNGVAVINQSPGAARPPGLDDRVRLPRRTVSALPRRPRPRRSPSPGRSRSPTRPTCSPGP